MGTVLDPQLWASARNAALRRDGHRCTVARLLGGQCVGTLHVHHIVARAEGGELYDLDNLATACAAHHPIWESLRRVVVRRMTQPLPRCPHQHRTAEGRRICEERMARERGLLVA